MSCRDPEILALQSQAEAAAQRAGDLRLAANYADGQACREQMGAADAVAAEATRLRRRAQTAETRYRADVRTLSTGFAALRLDAETVDALISQHTGGRTTSRTETTAAERAAILRTLRERGFRPRVSARRRAVQTEQAQADKEAMAGKVRALLLDAGRGDAYANGIAKTRFSVPRWEWLTFEQLEALLQMLIIDQTRRAARRLCRALAGRKPWRAYLTDGEIEHEIDLKAAAEARRRGWVSLGPDGRPLILTDAGRQMLRTLDADAGGQQ